MKSRAPARSGREPFQVVVVGDTVVSEQGMATIVGHDTRYRVCGTAHSFREANEVIQRERPDLLLIDPFLENRDGIRWIRDLATEFPRARIIIASRQSEQTFAERALRAGAWGYWMRTSSAEELLHAMETVLTGEVYVSPLIRSHAMHKFAGHRDVPHSLNVLSDREMAVFALIAAGTRHRSDRERAWYLSQDGRDALRTHQAQTRLPKRRSVASWRARVVRCKLSTQRRIPDSHRGSRTQKIRDSPR